MIKILTYIATVAAGLAILGGGIWAYQTHTVWLAQQNLALLARVGLIIWGIVALVMPIHLLVHWSELTAVGLPREYITRGGMVVGTLAALASAAGLTLTIIFLPGLFNRPAWIIPWLMLLSPVFRVAVDLYQENYPRTLRKAAQGLAMYAFYLYGMIAMMIGFAVGALALFPAGILLQFLSAADWVARQLGAAENGVPLLCAWFQVGETACAPALFTFHIGHALLIWTAVSYGERPANVIADGYARGVHWLTDRVKGP